jgi:hypothetical protein
MVFPTQQALVATPGWTGFAAETQHDRANANLDFVSDLRRDFGKRDALYGLIDQCIFLEQKVVIPENFQATAVEARSPYPRHIANQITAALSINAPRVTFNPIKDGDTGEDEAAFRARFFEASWKRQRREKRRNIYRRFMDSVVTKGDGWLKCYERKNRAWAKYTEYSQKLLKELDAAVERGDMDAHARTQLWDSQTEKFKRTQPYPIETTEIPPEHVYYQRGEDGFTRVVEVSAVPYYETLLKYGATLNEKGKVIQGKQDGEGNIVAFDDATGPALPPSQWGGVWGRNYDGRRTLEKVEIWDNQRAMIVLRGPGDIGKNLSRGGGMVVKEWKHGYGNKELGTLDGPYFFCPGIETSSNEPHKAQLSVLFAYLHLFPLLNALLTMQSQAAFSTAFPAYKRTTPPTYNMPNAPFGLAADEIEQRRQKIVPGAIFPHDIGPMDQPHTSIDLDKAIQFVKAMIDLALPDSVQGVITGETVGYALNQAVHLASLQWSPIVDNAQICLGDRVSWESRLIDEFIGEMVYVWGNIPQPRRRPGQTITYKGGWMGIGPAQLGGVHNYDVLLEPVSINNDQLELRIIRDELDMRLMAPDEAVRRRGRNPVEVERAWLLYELKQDPEIRNNLKQRVFAGLNTIEQASMQELPPGTEPGGVAPVEMSGLPPGAQPGVSQGLPTTGFVPPAGSVAPAAPAAPPGPQLPPGQPGVPQGAPAGVRNAPPNAEPIPGGG